LTSQNEDLIHSKQEPIELYLYLKAQKANKKAQRKHSIQQIAATNN